MAIDADAAIHVAVTGSTNDNQGIWYLTNATGQWARQQVAVPATSPDYETPGRDDQPTVAIDPSDGSVWIAFVYWACADCIPNASDGLYVVNNVGGTWSAPILVAAGSFVSPSLVVRGGHVYLAYAEQAGYSTGSIWFGADASGTWLSQRIGKGSLPHLALDAQEQASILFTASDVRFARQKADGTFAVEHVPNTTDAWADSRLVIDSATGDVWAAWTGPATGGGQAVLVARRGGDGWTDALAAVSAADLFGLAAHNGIIHLIANKSGITYAVNAGGTFAEQVIVAATVNWQSSALALFPNGRPVVVFTRDHGDDIGIWFLKGPAG